MVTKISELLSSQVVTGDYQGEVIDPAYGGTGVANNTASTITINGNFSLGLTLSGNSTITLPTTGTLTTLATVLATANTWGATQNFADNILQRPELKDYSETVTNPSSSSNVLTLDIANSNYFYTTLTENVTTLTISNPSPTAKLCSVTLEIIQGGSGSYTIAWPASFEWPNGGVAASLSTAVGAKDVITFYTRDAGTTWNAFLAGNNIA